MHFLTSLCNVSYRTVYVVWLVLRCNPFAGIFSTNFSKICVPVAYPFVTVPTGFDGTVKNHVALTSCMEPYA